MSGQLVAEPGDCVTAAMFDGLPRIVQRYLEWSGVEGCAVPTSMSLRQTGRLRSAEDKPWRPFTAREDFVTGPPCFTWQARMRIAGLPVVHASDSYIDGHGRMEVRLARVRTLADLRGPEMDEASLLRFLNELAWLPAAYLLPCIRWAEVDDTHARVSITDAGRTVAATMTFARTGRPISFAALRHRHHGNGRFSKDVWVTPFTEYGLLGGLCVPVAGWAEYRLASGPLRYIELHVDHPASNAG